VRCGQTMTIKATAGFGLGDRTGLCAPVLLLCPRCSVVILEA